jgi:hypothetical protein
LESNSLSAESNNEHFPKTPPKDNAGMFIICMIGTYGLLIGDVVIKAFF